MRSRFLVSLLFLACQAFSKEHLLQTPDQLGAALKHAKPGDELLLPPGEWKDIVLTVHAEGTAEDPIVVRAAQPGTTLLTGKCGLRIAGRHITVAGLWFKNPDAEAGDCVEFRKSSKQVATHCRLTDCAITLEAGLGSTDGKESRWLGLYGSDNRVDHCAFQGKTARGATTVVWLGASNAGRHIIENNYFGPREKLDKNGGETIRVGDSKTSMQKADCVIRNNLFERCNGEAECISNKSCGNLYQGNVFVEVSGTLTLRHGNGCTVEKNLFFGNKVKGTGGIRIIGEDHTVRGNYLENLAGDEIRSGITFMLGIPDSPAHGYFQVRRAQVLDNVLLDCAHSLLIGLAGNKVEGDPTLPPADCLIQGNRILTSKEAVLESRCDLAGITWKDNQFFSQSSEQPAINGIVWNKPESLVKRPMPARETFGPSWFAKGQ